VKLFGVLSVQISQSGSPEFFPPDFRNISGKTCCSRNSRMSCLIEAGTVTIWLFQKKIQKKFGLSFERSECDAFGLIQKNFGQFK
jgi:hypothetical protein